MKPGDVVRDNYNRLGIIIKQADRPDREWIEHQNDKRVKALSDDVVWSLSNDIIWWEVLPFEGGSCFTPEPLTKFVHKATMEDFHEVFENANDDGKRDLAEVGWRVVIEGEKYA